MKYIFTLLCMTCFSQFAYSDEALRVAPPGVSTGSIVQMILSLVLVLGFIILVAWILKRMNLAQTGSVGGMKVIGSLSLGQRERMVLVEVHDSYLIIGITPGQIRTLHSFAKTEDFNPSTSSDSVPHKQFAQLLASVIKQRK